jgi:hypothetical protein
MPVGRFVDVGGFSENNYRQFIGCRGGVFTLELNDVHLQQLLNQSRRTHYTGRKIVYTISYRATSPVELEETGVHGRVRACALYRTITLSTYRMLAQRNNYDSD